MTENLVRWILLLWAAAIAVGLIVALSPIFLAALGILLVTAFLTILGRLVSGIFFK